MANVFVKSATGVASYESCLWALALAMVDRTVRRVGKREVS